MHHLNLSTYNINKLQHGSTLYRIFALVGFVSEIERAIHPIHHRGPARVNSDKRHGPKSSDSNQMK